MNDCSSICTEAAFAICECSCDVVRRLSLIVLACLPMEGLSSGSHNPSCTCILIMKLMHMIAVNNGFGDQFEERLLNDIWLPTKGDSQDVRALKREHIHPIHYLKDLRFLMAFIFSQFALLSRGKRSIMTFRCWFSKTYILIQWHRRGVEFVEANEYGFATWCGCLAICLQDQISHRFRLKNSLFI